MLQQDEAPAGRQLQSVLMSGGRKLAIICSKGNLDMAYPGLILANAALGEGVETHLFFTFWGFDMIAKSRMNDLKFSPTGNTAMHMPIGDVRIPQALAPMPGMQPMATHMLKKQIADLGVPEVPDFLDSQHTIETRADCEAYVARLEAFARMMDDEAERVLRATLSQQQELLGPEHADVQVTRMALANTLSFESKSAEARDDLLRKAVVHELIDRQVTDVLATSAPSGSTSVSPAWPGRPASRSRLAQNCSGVPSNIRPQPSEKRVSPTNATFASSNT